MILAVAEKSGRVSGGRVEQLDRHLVVHRLVGLGRGGRGRAFTELFEIFVTRPRKVVSGKASIWTTAESPTLMRGDVGLVDLHLGLEHAHVADR